MQDGFHTGVRMRAKWLIGFAISACLAGQTPTLEDIATRPTGYDIEPILLPLPDYQSRPGKKFLHIF